MTDIASTACVIRLGGLPTDATDSLGTPALRDALVRLAACDAEAARERLGACDLLFPRIGAEADPARRGALLRVRRALFNARPPRAADLDLALASLHGDEARAVTRAVVALTAGADAAMAVADAYPLALAGARDRVRSALEDARMRDGLLLSSPTLFGNLRRYAAPSGGRMAARDLQIERGLLRYLTRASMKATPFAAFCTVVPGRVDLRPTTTTRDAELWSYTTTGSLSARRNLVRINKALYGTLWEHAKRRPAIRDALTVELNPTLREGGSELNFLAAIRNLEVFQRLERSEVLDLVTGMIGQHAGCRYDALVQALASDERIEATPEEARAFLDGLTSAGLLRFRAPVRAQDSEWALPFARLLDGIDDEHATTIVALLREADAVAESYVASDSATRSVLGERLRASIAAALVSLGVPVGKEAGLPLYEDCGADLEITLSSSSDLAGSLEALRGFVEGVLPLAHPRAEMATMRYFFDARYGPDRAGVPLLAFYEDFYRDHFREHLEKERKLRAGVRDPDLSGYNLRNPFALESVDRILAATRAWTEAVRAAWQGDPLAEEITLTPAMIPQVSGVPPISPASPRSVAMFCQLAPPASGATRPRVVTNSGQLYLGFGKYFSRFLDLLPPSFTRDLVERNAGVTTRMLAEIAGDANFNGNLHPRLLPFQIAYPTGDGEEGDGTLLANDLVVERDPGDASSLCLRHAETGRVVQPLDLGFLSPQMRPALYQLLMHFAPIGGHGVALPTSVAPTGVASAEVSYRPRIVYDGVLVMARRRWTVPAALFPRREPGESEQLYFIRLYRWRESLGIPAAVYVRVFPERARQTPGGSPTPAAQAPVEPSSAEIEEGGQEPDPMIHTTLEALDALPSADESEDRVAVGSEVAASGAAAVAVVMRAAKETRAPKATPGYSRDFVKPQFIDFTSPLLADLFGRLPATLANFTVQIEERYPGADALPVLEGRRYTAEFILQLDWPATHAND